jgi:hypothetical protein
MSNKSPRARCRRGLWLIALAVVLFAVAGEAAYLRNVPQTVAQPDGTVLHLFATGDEYYNWLHDADGYVVVRDSQTGYLVYAVKTDLVERWTARTRNEERQVRNRPHPNEIELYYGL